jgi:hypothetical protein
MTSTPAAIIPTPLTPISRGRGAVTGNGIITCHMGRPT